MKYLSLAPLAFVALTAFAGCSESRNRSDSPHPASVSIEASSREIVAGETVTLTARTKDTYGRNTTIKWTSTAGTLTTEQDGRVARVKFDAPGTYSVRAALMADGREMQSDMTEIRVKPVG